MLHAEMESVRRQVAVAKEWIEAATALTGPMAVSDPVVLVRLLEAGLASRVQLPMLPLFQEHASRVCRWATTSESLLAATAKGESHCTYFSHLLHPVLSHLSHPIFPYVTRDYFLCR